MVVIRLIVPKIFCVMMIAQDLLDIVRFLHLPPGPLTLVHVVLILLHGTQYTLHLVRMIHQVLRHRLMRHLPLREPMLEMLLIAMDILFQA